MINHRPVEELRPHEFMAYSWDSLAYAATMLMRLQHSPFGLPELVALYLNDWRLAGGAYRFDWIMVKVGTRAWDSYHKFRVIGRIPVFDETFQYFFEGELETVLAERIQYGRAGNLVKLYE